MVPSPDDGGGGAVVGVHEVGQAEALVDGLKQELFFHSNQIATMQVSLRPNKNISEEPQYLVRRMHF